jgi:hypothetical protein
VVISGAKEQIDSADGGAVRWDEAKEFDIAVVEAPGVIVRWGWREGVGWVGVLVGGEEFAVEGIKACGQDFRMLLESGEGLAGLLRIAILDCGDTQGAEGGQEEFRLMDGSLSGEGQAKEDKGCGSEQEGGGGRGQVNEEDFLANGD